MEQDGEEGEEEYSTIVFVVWLMVIVRKRHAVFGVPCGFRCSSVQFFGVGMCGDKTPPSSISMGQWKMKVHTLGRYCNWKHTQ